MSHTVLVEPYPSARLRLAILFVSDNRESTIFQPGYDSSQFRGVEHLYCLLYRQPPARQQVGEDFALWVSCHILVVLVCTRIGGQATPGKSSQTIATMSKNCLIAFLWGYCQRKTPHLEGWLFEGDPGVEPGNVART